MIWLIRGKMFTYFHNKFRPVNRMHYIKCVHSSSHNSGCCRFVTPWITVLSQNTIFTMEVIYYKFTFVWYSAKQGTTHRPTSHLAHLYTVPFLWLQEEHRWQCRWVDDFAGQCLLWWLLLRFAAAAAAANAVLLLPTKIVFNITSIRTWFQVGVSNQNFTCGFLLKFYFFFWPLLKTHIHLPCLDYYVWLGTFAET